MNIVVIEDNKSSRNEAKEMLEFHLDRHQPVVHTIDDYPKAGVAPICMDLFRIASEDRLHRIEAIVLDLHLGQGAWGGFQIVKALSHCMPGCGFVINSSQFNDEETMAEAKRLGIRFGCLKNSESLPDLVKAAVEVGSIRARTVSWAVEWMTRPITPCEGNINQLHLELLDKTRRFGLAYTGARESINFRLVREIEKLAKICYVAESTEHCKMVQERNSQSNGNKDPDYFENSYTTVADLARLTETIKQSLARTEPFITFR